MTPAQLRTHIQSQQELASWFAAGNDQQIADWYAGDSGSTIRQKWMDKGRFLLEILPAVTAIPYLADSQKRSMWQLIFGVIQSSEWVEITHPRTLALLGMAVSDSLLTQQQADAVGVRPATRAEIAFGEGAAVSVQQIGEARAV